MRHLPSANEHANRVWLTSALLALNLNLTAWCCDLCPAAGASGKAPDDAPLRRAAHTLRRILFCIPPRLRLPVLLAAPGSCAARAAQSCACPKAFRHADVFKATLDAVYALPPP